MTARGGSSNPQAGRAAGRENDICRIFKVPNEISHEEYLHSFQPKILSIGPYHHGSPRLERMESVKSAFLDRISENDYDRYKIRASLANDARMCYNKDITMEPNNFAKMLLLDGCFILAALTGMQGSVAREMLPNHHEALNRHDIVHDLLLVQNQIPFFVLTKICRLAPGEGETTESLEVKIATYLKGVLGHYPRAIKISEILSNDIHHLLHLCHMFFQPSLGIVKHKGNQVKTDKWRRAVDYKNAGVKFRVKGSSTRHSLLDVTFNDNIMKIPHLSIDGKMESIFSNLIIFESEYPCNVYGKYITAYVTFMSRLLRKVDDVALLADKKIIEILGPKEEILNIFHRLKKLANLNPRTGDHYLQSVFQSVEAYYTTYVNRHRQRGGQN